MLPSQLMFIIPTPLSGIALSVVLKSVASFISLIQLMLQVERYMIQNLETRIVAQWQSKGTS